MDTMTQTLHRIRKNAGRIIPIKKSIKKADTRVMDGQNNEGDLVEELTPQQKAARTRAKNKEKDK